jgi:hypothetical protein
LGLSDAFRLLPARPAGGAIDHLEEPGTSSADRADRPAAPVGEPGGCWVPAGQATEVAGLTLPGGMIYVGEELPAAKGGGPDPALINPLLPVDLSNPDWAGATVGYWPSYAGISAGARAAYLKWLADGRPGLGVPIGWVFLYFYGLERRVVQDGAAAARAGELPDIADEVRRLRDYCRHHGSFHAYATQFLALLDAVGAAAEPLAGAPRWAGRRWPVPYRLRVGLGRLAAGGTPVPADWAMSWIGYHPDIHPRTPAERCPAEFERLAAAHYTARHGAGLLVDPDGDALEHVYMAANVGIGQVTVSLGVPDVLQLPGPARDLRALAEECSEALDAYSRYLGRHPGGQESLAATALLPPELADHSTEAMRDLRGWLDGRLAGLQRVLVDAAEFTVFWPAEASDGLARADAATLTRLLEGQGIGVEPDVRLGGTPGLGSGPVVLFRLADGRPAVSRAVYAAATVTLHLAAAVALADGPAPAAARLVLQAHVAESGLAAPAAARLQAHLEWLLAGEVKLTGLARRVAILDEPERDQVADLLVSVAATEALVSPAAINALTRSFRLLGRDPATVYSAVHARGARPATAPVVVRPVAARPPGAAVPPPPAPAADVRLDRAVIAAKLAETATVSALLGSIFTGDGPAADGPAADGAAADGAAAEVAAAGPGPAAADGPQDFERHAGPSQPGTAGLDGAHSALLRTIATRDSWARAEMQEACAAVALMLDGALDTLNEAAYEVAGDPLTDGDDPISIDLNVAQEMLA